MLAKLGGLALLCAEKGWIKCLLVDPLGWIVVPVRDIDLVVIVIELTTRQWLPDSFQFAAAVAAAAFQGVELEWFSSC